MTEGPSLSARPSLTGAAPADAGTAPRDTVAGGRLLDLMFDGFYLLVLLKRGQLPSQADTFASEIQSFLEGVERSAMKNSIASEDIYAAKYAFCAAVDEVILSQPTRLRDEWERHPLQLRLFGDHLAGQHFFDYLEDLRAQGAPRLASLEVYHYCLLLGFEGKYRLDGTEKLGYLIARLGDEIAYLKGQRSGFAPHWAPPDNVRHTLRRVVPLWLPLMFLAGFAVLAFFGLRLTLNQQTETSLAAYQNIVQMPERTAHITITLP
ncbi:putative transmembrane protein [Alloalcanivorax dieselolei B5]|uniref:Putative transmembrane protein n=1 Tax=Alcanivorax dieselolei (strain DSM 16502 / CGMCC 1.3690 / MCCC 1A00001 / B-5) TaxID=930169 RepID=K0CD29_ALCDB|nr:type IVB secretion system protein IcmH/DotU [Alloalcanivorax dieselolei]AFT70463.1 putative transmembrane protein [Alloalcanivorax dieselolei B5]GGJ84492.1 hypothetical protein GCM10007426_11990 [Alloalcanivorax dieselolei]